MHPPAVAWVLYISKLDVQVPEQSQWRPAHQQLFMMPQLNKQCQQQEAGPVGSSPSGQQGCATQHSR